MQATVGDFSSECCARQATRPDNCIPVRMRKRSGYNGRMKFLYLILAWLLPGLVLARATRT
jgi:hypothetical protein